MVPNDQTEHVDLGKQNGESMRVGSSSFVAAATSMLKLGGKAAII